jgi:phosphohistidine phosphatase
MQVLFVRHGEAEEVGHGVPGEDARRRLVKAGRRQTRKVAGALNYLGLRPRVILTSPLARARETAEIIAKRVKRSPDPQTSDSLKPGGTWQALRRDIIRHISRTKGKRKTEGIVCAVGHQPDLSRIVSEALCGAAVGFKMEKSACILLRWEDAGMSGEAAVSFAIEPDIL